MPDVTALLSHQPGAVLFWSPWPWPLLGLVLLAMLLDLCFGDPEGWPHPVIVIGRMIAWLEQRWNHGRARRRYWLGVCLTLTVVGGIWALSTGVLYVLSQIHPWLALIAELLLLATTFAAHGLAKAGMAVYRPLIAGDLDGARCALGQIVGRDTERLNEVELTRGAVESVAENSVDGITAPLFWALIGGAPLALAYKAVNTLDSMVGYRNARFSDFGCASARLDDVVNWLPARLTALSLWLSSWLLPHMRRSGALAGTWRQARAYARKRHASPNAGWPEAMVANLLGVRLGGVNHYQGVASPSAELGRDTTPLRAEHIRRAIWLMHGGWVAFLVLMLPVIALWNVTLWSVIE